MHIFITSPVFPGHIQRIQTAGRKNFRQKGEKSEKIPRKIEKLIAESVSDLSSVSGDDGDGYVFMGELGNLILKKQPDFDCRNFGYKSLSALIKSMDRFEVDFRHTTDPNIKHPYVRDKKA